MPWATTVMRLLHPSRLRARDRTVLIAQHAALETAGTTTSALVAHLVERDLERVELPDDEDMVPLPYCEVEEGQEDDPAAYRFIDPPFDGPAIHYRDVLERQFVFLALLAHSALAGSGPAIGGMASALGALVLRRRTERGGVPAKVLADLLHQHRWSPGSELTAELFHEALLGRALDPEEADRELTAQAANPRFIEARMGSLGTRFEGANEEATSLTDWAERLYRLRPHVRELTRYLRISDLEGTDRRLGFVLHLDSLIGGRLRALERLAEAEALEPATAPRYFDADLEAARVSGDSQLGHLLDEFYRHRRVLPRFWYDAAKGSLGADAERLPAELRSIDPYRIVSMQCLEAWSEAWYDRVLLAKATDSSAGLPGDFMAKLRRMNRPPGPTDRDPGPPPHRSHLRRRDYQIIRVGVEHFSLPGFDDVPPLWTAMLQGPPALDVLPFEEEFANVPRVRGIHDPEDNSVTAISHDPPWTGECVPYLETLDEQTAFFRQMATCHRRDAVGADDQLRAFRTLRQALWAAGEKHGSAYARSLVERWHAHRWAPGTQLTGLLLYRSVDDPNREGSVRTDERVKIENNGTLINAHIKDVQRRIDEAKENVQTLTEWAEALYRLSPYNYELRAMLDLSEGANADAWHERFSAVGDQIIDVGALNMATVVRTASDRPEYPTWTTMYLDDIRREEGSAADTWKRLEHLCREQVTFPKFWYELALKHLDTPLEKMPPALTALDAYRVASIDVLECWSAQFIHAGRGTE